MTLSNQTYCFVTCDWRHQWDGLEMHIHKLVITSFLPPAGCISWCKVVPYLLFSEKRYSKAVICSRLHWQMGIANLKLPNNVCHFLDTMELLKVLRPGLKSYKLTDLAADAGFETFNAHNASDDAKVLQRLVSDAVYQWDPDMSCTSNNLIAVHSAWNSEFRPMPASAGQSQQGLVSFLRLKRSFKGYCYCLIHYY